MTRHRPDRAAPPGCSSRCSRCPRRELGHRRDRRPRPPSRRGSAAAGLGALQLLPINEMAPGQQSPYSAISAMAIDPIFISCHAVPDFVALGGEAALTRGDRRPARRGAPRGRVEYADGPARSSRARCARRFERFLRHRVACASTGTRARRSAAFLSEQAWWLDDYALFRAIHAREGERPWTEWPPTLQRARSRGARSRAPRAASARCCSISTCSGSRTTSGSTRARTAARRRAVRRSAVHGRTATAPTSGRGRISSGSTPRSARRPTRSARPARTGACRSTAGT